MKGGCELCSNQARVYCDSDQARLCFECDGRVHSANFLVAKHCRTLLCHVCQTPTPWKASGPKLGPTISVCQNCFLNNSNNNTNPGGNEEEIINLQSENDESCNSESDDDDDEDYSSFSDSDGDNYDDGVEADDGDNQVVPWSCCNSSDATSSHQPPLPASSSSSEEEMATDCGGATVSSSSKRMRLLHYLDSDDEDEDEDECFSHPNNKASSMDCERPSSSSLKQVKIARTSGDFIEQIKGEISDPQRRRVGTVSSFTRFQKIMVDDELHASALINGISQMSRNN